MKFLRTALLTLRLALPKIGVAYMSVLLTSNLNRIAIREFAVPALIITIMIGLHNFISPLQVFWGRASDRHPLRGYHRTPYILGGAFVASLAFPLLPPLLAPMRNHSVPAIMAGFAVLIVYGIALAAMGDSHHTLIADVTNERQRGSVMAAVWFVMIISIIASAIFLAVNMPTYDAATMQHLYNLTPFLVLLTTLAGILGIEHRSSSPRVAAQSGNVFALTANVLRINTDARRFFGFMFLAICAIFVQDSILELFGAEVFKLDVGATSRFTSTWGAGALLGMVVVGVVSGARATSKSKVATLGGILVAIGLAGIAVSGFLGVLLLLTPSIFVMGLGAGIFNVGALALMMDMTPSGARGTYMGIWGMAQALGTGVAAIVSGALHTVLIEQLGLAPAPSYLLIFSGEAMLMVGAIVLLREVSVQRFIGATSMDLRELPVLDGLAA
ncbi:MAG: BCD family MFS transporter [Herpetosiphonaceae bacterium]|nr:BCD family MFS transporter [Herpetosiphonaceae bacterium]